MVFNNSLIMEIIIFIVIFLIFLLFFISFILNISNYNYVKLIINYIFIFDY